MTVGSLAVISLSACAPSGGGSSDTTDRERAFELAVEACSQEDETGGSMGSIARLASQAAQLDDRWRTLADYATSLNSAFELALDIEEAGRQATDSELETIRQGRQDGPRLLSECEAVLAQATENKP